MIAVVKMKALLLCLGHNERVFFISMKDDRRSYPFG